MEFEIESGSNPYIEMDTRIALHFKEKFTILIPRTGDFVIFTLYMSGKITG
ncbi:hypothetical protein IQ35_02522 [Sphingobium wenxiniae]|uniref:Uncharacterized protein n=1 Tax=Sphingobium wenxiniae (strain DSM 21828 / CGMCC 1.7748 / JZ-1) TaxID=595605 RepID=A0A562KAG0_SPHWJ|nr:hypothetical protein [Sphingobium baderi]TWH92409.1 hypothetical protein IQ35_02522 [Sphingobium wenxiniae]WRD76045.1 hypothetical protein QQ987_14915 [Sphingobium baderi]